MGVIQSVLISDILACSDLSWGICWRLIMLFTHLLFFWYQVWTTGNIGTSDLWLNCTSVGGLQCNPASAGGRTLSTFPLILLQFAARQVQCNQFFNPFKSFRKLSCSGLLTINEIRPTCMSIPSDCELKRRSFYPSVNWWPTKHFPM